jgi:multicomponent Na+:H+ antiporter subunit G
MDISPISVVVHILMLCGSIIMVFGVVGMIILPDLFLRFHAATKCGVSGTLCILVALSIRAGSPGFILKFIVILFFFIFTSPIIAHMLAISRLGEDANDDQEDA